MSKSFHRDYADSVGHFCQSIPSMLGITSQEIDAYFRACTLCLWAASGGRGGDVIGINQIYTDRQVKFTPEQFEKAMSYYRANPDYNVGVPEFFVKLAEYDALGGTCCSRSFAEIQKNLLMLAAAYDGTFSFAESRRITLLYDLLTAECDRQGVQPAALTPGPERYMDRCPRVGGEGRRDEAGELNRLMDEFSRVIRRDTTKSMYQDFFGSEPPPAENRQSAPAAAVPGSAAAGAD